MSLPKSGLVLALALAAATVSPASAQSPLPGETTLDRCIAVTALMGASLMNAQDPDQQSQGHDMLERAIELLPAAAVDPSEPDRDKAVRSAVMSRVTAFLESVSPGEFDYQGAVALWQSCNTTFPTSRPGSIVTN